MNGHVEKLERLVLAKPVLSLTLIFTLSRGVLYSLFPFRIDFLPWLNQLLDTDLLKHDLLRSIYYLHATPPLYNLFIGIMLKLFPDGVLGFAFSFVYFLMGLGMVLMLYRILRSMGVGNGASFIGGLVFIADPILFRFEIIPFYTYPLTFLLLGSLYLLVRFLETSRKHFLVACLALPLILLLTRNFFHVIFYFIPIAAGLSIFVYRTRRHLFKMAVIGSTIFLAIGLVPNIRNELSYGIFSSSTWQGMQLYSLVYFVPKDTIDTLVKEKAATPLVYVPRFQNPDIYYAYYHKTPREGIPALDNLYKSTGEGNFNNWIYIQTSKEYQKNAFAILARYPQYFGERFVNSVYIFFGFANYRYFDKTADWLVWNGGVFYRAYQAAKYFVFPLAFAILFAFIIWWLFSNLWQALNSKKLLENKNIIYSYILFNLLYVFGVANAVELGENDTSRVPTDPLIIIMVVAIFYGIAKRWGHTRGVAFSAKMPDAVGEKLTST